MLIAQHTVEPGAIDRLDFASNDVVHSAISKDNGRDLLKDDERADTPTQTYVPRTKS